MKSSDRDGSKSFTKLFQLIRLIAESPDGLSGKDVAGKAVLPVSTVFRMLKFLTDEGYLFHDHARYLLGSGLIGLGLRAREQNPLHRIAHPQLVKLAAHTFETIHLAVLRGHEVCYYDKIEGGRNVRMGSLVGSLAPVYCTGVGKAILAFLPRTRQDDILSAVKMKRFTPATLTGRKMIREELKKISRCGYAVDNCEHEAGVFCIAAPILDLHGCAIAGISISGSERYLRNHVPSLAGQIQEAASTISEQLNRADCG